MSNTLKAALAIIVLILILVGVYYLFTARPAAPQQQQDTQNAMNSLGTTSEETTLPSGTSTSDASLQADLKAVDSQMSGFESDSASVNAGIDDQASAR